MAQKYPENTIFLMRVGGSGFPNLFEKFLGPFFVLKTSRNAMKHVISGSGGHI